MVSNSICHEFKQIRHLIFNDLFPGELHSIKDRNSVVSINSQGINTISNATRDYAVAFVLITGRCADRPTVIPADEHCL